MERDHGGPQGRETAYRRPSGSARTAWNAGLRPAPLAGVPLCRVGYAPRRAPSRNWEVRPLAPLSGAVPV